MEFAQLQAFRAVAEELHFGRAAKRLHVAQPHLSRTIRALESELGASLFDRTTRRVELTPAGHALVESSEVLLKAYDELRADVAAAHRGERGRVRCSFAGPSSQAMVGRLARAVRERHERIDLEFRPGHYGNAVVRELLDGGTDLVFARYDHRPPGITSRPVSRESAVLVVPVDHRLASAATVSVAELRDEPFVALPEEVGSIVRERFVTSCQRNGFAPAIVQSAPDSWTCTALVAAGVGLHFTTDAAARNLSLNGVRVLDITDEIAPIFVHLAWRTDDTDPVLARVLAVSGEILPDC